jgi:hypothetical protein
MIDTPPRRDAGVTLQISVAPSDAPHARHILPHQLRRWAGQVDEVLFTLDLGRKPARRAELWWQRRREIEDLLDGLCDRYPVARVEPVDYTAATTNEVSQRLSHGTPVPDQDCYGKVVYPYFFGLFAARNACVLHTDSDVMFGGGGQDWIAEARRVLTHPEVFSCSPLPGPPSREPFPRHVAIGHAGSRRRRAIARNAVPFAVPGLPTPAFSFARMSTRCFMVNRSAFDRGDAALPVIRPGFRALVGAGSKGALAKGNPFCAPAETSLSRAMERLGLRRVDFLGTPPGMWSLHPPLRGANFYRTLPDIIRRIEAGDIPEGQNGDYDLNDSMVDWSDARAERGLARRLSRRLPR